MREGEERAEMGPAARGRSGGGGGARAPAAARAFPLRGARRLRPPSRLKGTGLLRAAAAGASGGVCAARRVLG